MFRKRCKRCGERISSRYSYCPFCGASLREKEKSIFGGGLLDELEEREGVRMPFPFGSLFDRLTRELDKQFREFDTMLGESKEKMAREEKPEKIRLPFVKSSGISISISTATGKRPVIKVKSFGIPKEEIRKIAPMIGVAEKKLPTKKLPKISEEGAAKLAKLPRKEALARVRRLARKIIYEIDLPGVRPENVIINKLENSIEIKAFSEDKAYFKLIPISLPLLKYYMQKGKLFLELRPEE